MRAGTNGRVRLCDATLFQARCGIKVEAGEIVKRGLELESGYPRIQLAQLEGVVGSCRREAVSIAVVRKSQKQVAGGERAGMNKWQRSGRSVRRTVRCDVLSSAGLATAA